MYFCTSYYPNCDENDNILAISIDVTQTLGGNISKWDTVACKVYYTSTITTNCRYGNSVTCGYLKLCNPGAESLSFLCLLLEIKKAMWYDFQWDNFL